MIRAIIWLAHFITSLAAINWGLFKFLNIDLVEQLATRTEIQGLGYIIYAIITLSGCYGLIGLFSRRKPYNE